MKVVRYLNEYLFAKESVSTSDVYQYILGAVVFAFLLGLIFGQ